MRPRASDRHAGDRPARSFRRLLPLATLAVLVAAIPAPAATPSPPVAAQTITSPTQIWQMSTAMKSVAHPLRIEGRVDYYDPLWKLCWLERDHVSTFLSLSSNPPVLRVGQYVVISGHLTPTVGLAADSVKVKVVRDHVPVQPLDTAGRINDLNALSGRVVTVTGYVDGQQLIDNLHLRLTMVVQNRPVIAWVRPDNTHALPRWQGRFVRLVGVYSGRFTPTGTDITIEIWASRERDVTPLESIRDDPAFRRPRTAIDTIWHLPMGTEIRVRGRLQAQQAGSSLTLRDATGQVVVHTVQRQRFPIGTEIEAVGRVANTEGRWELHSGLYRRAENAGRAPSPGTAVGALDTISQIRRLTPGQAEAGRPVTVAGMVTWSMPDLDFFYLQDMTGGIRVHFRRDQMPAPALVQYLEIQGVTRRRGMVPEVELRHYRDLGSMSAPPARHITLEQAMTGAENGQWVEMRGFLRRIDSDGDWRRVQLVTAAGEFTAVVLSPVNLDANPGSLIIVDGVCDTTATSRGRITGVTLHVPFLHSFSVEEDAPADPFALPVRRIASLGRLSAAQTLMRVHVRGVVVYAVPDRYFYLQDDGAGLLVLSRDHTSLAPGDVIDAVGILGRTGARTMLREAEYRRHGRAPLPAPLALDPARLTSALDARLVRVRGTLVDLLHRPDRTLLRLQEGPTLYEATLNRTGVTLPPALVPGAGVELTGICRIDFDDARRLRGFHLELRSPLDVAIVHRAHFWTATRALDVAGTLAACVLLGLGWITALRRRVRRQTEQIRRQLERQARLEAEVQRAARLESLGVLAGGIAHDFNNLLTVVMGNVGLAMLDATVAGAAADLLHEIERAALRARDLTQQLLTFAKGGSPVLAAVSLPEIVREATNAVLHGSSTRCEVQVPPGLWLAEVDRAQISQAIRNLALNAVQAMAAGGVIRLEFANDTPGPEFRPGLAAGRYVRLTMTDSGEGIPPEVLPRIFDPYFTTRDQGSGLGLATVYSITRRHGGRIEVDSTPGRGTTVTLWLPAAEVGRPAAAPTIPAAPADVPRSRSRVLLMDDEASIRIVTVAALRRAGLEATAASDGAEALRVFEEARRAGQPFDLVILDLTVPGGMGGWETIRRLRDLDARVPAIVSSGYSNDPVMAEHRRHGFQAMVAKPYDLTRLLAVVHELLAAPR